MTTLAEQVVSSVLYTNTLEVGVSIDSGTAYTGCAEYDVVWIFKFDGANGRKFKNW